MTYKNWLIIGAGSIGALKPENIDSPKTKNVLTHAHALYNLREEKKIKDFFLYDINYRKQVEAEERWNCRSDYIIDNMDVFIIACDTEYHFDTIKLLIKENNPKLIICEKPFCNNYSQAKKIVKLCNKKNIKLVVNYSRRFNYNFQEFKKVISNQNVQSCTLKYGRGFKREACHFIDFCNLWFGKYETGVILNNNIVDINFTDKTYAAYLRYEKCPNVFITPLDSAYYGIFEIEIFTDFYKYVFSENGRTLKKYYIIKEKVYGDYKVLSEEPLSAINTNLEDNLINMYNDIINGNDIVSTGETALKVHEVYKKLGV